MKMCGVKISPIFNRLVIFETTDSSFHGLPDPVQCPNTMSRKSLALYYYSNGRTDFDISQKGELHGTLFLSRPKSIGDHLANSFLRDPKKIVRRFVPNAMLEYLRKKRGQ